MSKKFNFIVIDDSALDCFIAEKMILQTGLCENIKSFTHADDAFTYIQTQSDSIQTVIVIDVIMPVMDACEFVSAFEQFPQSVQEKYKILAFTCSMNTIDKAKIMSFHSVKSLLNKPLTVESLVGVLQE